MRVIRKSAAVRIRHSACKAPRLVDIGAMEGLLGTGVLALFTHSTACHSGDDDADAPMVASADDHALFARMEDRMASRGPRRDPKVTLALLARSLHAPAKIMSIAAASANLQRGAVTQAVLDEKFWKRPTLTAALAAPRQKPRATRAAGPPTQKPDFALIASFFAKPFQNQKIPPITPSSEEWRSGLTHRS